MVKKIGELEIVNDGLTVTIRAFTVLDGERLTARMQDGWTAIPLESIVDLAQNIIDHGPRWNVIDLRTVLRIKN